MTTNWLSYRSPSGDATKARWPVAPEWDGVRRARLADEAHGLARMVEGRRRATVLGLTPGLVGYLASYAAAMGTEGIADTCDLVPELLERYEKHSERQFADRVAEKVKKARL